MPHCGGVDWQIAMLSSFRVSAVHWTREAGVIFK
jgi:hypothetical protein